MILTKEVEYIANQRNKFILKKMLNIDIIFDKLYLVSIDKLSKKSNKLVKVKCDKCDKEVEIPYSCYTSYTKNNTINYLCVKCCKIRTKETCLKNMVLKILNKIKK